MYIAKIQKHRKTSYIIRQSVENNGNFLSEDLFDLGRNPGDWVAYPGGNSFYIRQQVRDSLDKQGVDWDDDGLEALFYPFLHPETQRVIDGFSHPASGRAASLREQARQCETHTFELFDQRRAHYLRFGQIDQSGLARAPKKIYRKLLGKSRDEIEQYFRESEKCLRPHEKKTYAFVIFNVGSHFSSQLAKNMPQALTREKLDACFLEEVCRLNADRDFWADIATKGSLNDHLVRYVCWFFDTEFEQTRYLDDMADAWIKARRQFRPPEKPAMEIHEALAVMGLTQNELNSLTVTSLTRRYRKMARKTHPDQGGDHDRFVRLGQAYADLLRKVKARGKKPRFRRR